MLWKNLVQGVVELASRIESWSICIETGNMLIDSDGVEGSSTRWNRQSPALFFAPDIHSNVIL